MLKKLTRLVFILECLFVMNYEGYQDFGTTELERLLSVPVPPERIFCENVECIDETLALTGAKHLISIIKLCYDEEQEIVTFEKKKIIQKYSIEEF